MVCRLQDRRWFKVGREPFFDAALNISRQEERVAAEGDPEDKRVIVGGLLSSMPGPGGRAQGFEFRPSKAESVVRSQHHDPCA